jgi:hypothetical protein
VSNLLLAKAEDRKKEIATRTALGASRWRIIRQVLIENLLLFLASGTVGLLLAFFCLKMLPLGDSLNVAQFGGVALNLRVLAFAAIVCLFTGLLFGLVPALKASHSDFNDTLKTSGGTTCDRRNRISAWLLRAKCFSPCLQTLDRSCAACLPYLAAIASTANPLEIADNSKFSPCLSPMSRVRRHGEESAQLLAGFRDFIFGAKRSFSFVSRSSWITGNSHRIDTGRVARDTPRIGSHDTESNQKQFPPTGRSKVPQPSVATSGS